LAVTTRSPADVPDNTTGGASDALVFFGASGDLARQQIFPALYAMTKRGVLNVPVIGVAHSNWTVADLRKRARDSIKRVTGGIDDRRALDALLSRLRYVDGDYADRDTFTRLKSELGAARHPAHYLAIPLTTSPSHRRSSVTSFGSSARWDWPTVRVSSWRSLSAATSRPLGA